MKIAIATSGNILKSSISEHFGRSNYYCIYNADNQETDFFENPIFQNPEMDMCVTGEYFVDKKVTAVVAGRFGAKIIEYFRERNIQMIMPEKLRTAKDIINLIK